MSTPAIIKAIDVEQANRRKSVHDLYDMRLRPARRALSIAKRKLAEAEDRVREAERKANELQLEELETVQTWAQEAKRVAQGGRPVTMSEIRSVKRTIVTTDGPKSISMPRIKCLDEARA